MSRQYQYAKYTQTLYDTLIDEPNLLENLQLSDTLRTNTFQAMFKARWNGYEIGAETIKMFKFNIENVFNQHKNYYEELITAYNEKINMLDGIITSTTIDETYKEVIDDNTTTTQTGTNNTTGTYESELSHIDLPRTTASEERPTYKDNEIDTSSIDNTTNVNVTNANDKTKDNTGNKEVLIKGGISVIELKKQYIGLIRNVYLEFVNKFEKCFLTLFD